MSKQRFLVSLITKDNDYQVDQAEAARSKASELGVDAEIIYADITTPLRRARKL